MSEFSSTYRDFVKKSVKSDRYYGFDLKALARLEPVLKFLYQDWWKVEFSGLELLPKSGPCVIVGNQGSVLPWQAIMLLYAMMADRKNPRRLHIMYDLDWIEDERLHAFLVEIGFVPWSSANMKRLFEKGEIVAIFPEGLNALSKPFSQRYRLQGFDWTRLLPVVEEGLEIFPLATLGCDEAVPILAKSGSLAEKLHLPFFPITPFFPWFPFPFNFASLPVHWKMSLMKSVKYEKSKKREQIELVAKELSSVLEGGIQAELNKLFRHRDRIF
ncbi:MAG: 1-acyl-sn-glycerol-3-phosphate acyltransferase [Candidatus Obscuribacterales bacterium]